jgi:hypothetical protein
LYPKNKILYNTRYTVTIFSINKTNNELPEINSTISTVFPGFKYPGPTRESPEIGFQAMCIS